LAPGGPNKIETELPSAWTRIRGCPATPTTLEVQPEPEAPTQIATGSKTGGLSGRRGSNSRHSAWKADALPIELLPRGECGRRNCACNGPRARKLGRALRVEGVGFEPTKADAGRFTACSHWPLGQPSKRFVTGALEEPVIVDETDFRKLLELERGLEPLTFCLQNRCSTS
jgi:hypothetical protein